MIQYPSFPVEDWNIRETELHLDVLAQTESIFALANGHVGLRGNLEEGEPYGLPGTYLNSFYEQHPLPYAEPGFGYPESGQTIINVTNGKIIRLFVNDEPFDVRHGELQSHERVLDLRNGVLRRNVCWTSPTGSKVKISSVRMVSLTQRSIVAISYEVEPLDAPVRVVLQSELVTNETLPHPGKDPRAGTVLESVLECEEHMVQGTRGLLIHHTQVSGLRIGAAMDHHIDGPPETTVESQSIPDIARVSIMAPLQPGQRLRIVKFIAYGWSNQRSRPAIHDQVMAALFQARMVGWEGLLTEQRAFLDNFWGHANVEIDGDPQIQQAVRFALFHILQSGWRAERRPLPAKGLTGPGYDGHTFWDTEIFVLPTVTLTFPHATADALRWRYSILDQARERARLLGLRGAAFPWRTIHGEECSGYWPASTAAFHINADIAYAVTQYIGATDDTVFEKEVGLELLVETARLWVSLGYYNADGQFRIDGVTGPDEYSALVDNNVYTNLMAQHNLYAAADVVKRYPEAAHNLGVDTTEIDSWHNAAEKMFIPYDESLGVTPQDDAFTRHDVWDFAKTSPDQYPLLKNFPYYDIYRKQVIKQADLVLAMQLYSDAFTPEQKARNFAYYEPLTVRDSSLSAATQAVIAAEVGQLQLAYDYLSEAVFMDLYDLGHNVRDGIHLASLAGAWTALVKGFGGVRHQGNRLSFAPRLPEAINRLAFQIVFHGCTLRIEVTTNEVRYRLLNGSPLKVQHYDNEITLPLNEVITQPIPLIKAGPRPEQPSGRAPVARRARASS